MVGRINYAIRSDHFDLLSIEDWFIDEIQPEPKKSVPDMHTATEGQSRTQRLSLIDLLTGDLGTRGHMNHQSNSSGTIKTTQPSQVSAPPNGIQTARGTFLSLVTLQIRSIQLRKEF